MIRKLLFGWGFAVELGKGGRGRWGGMSSWNISRFSFFVELFGVASEHLIVFLVAFFVGEVLPIKSHWALPPSEQGGGTHPSVAHMMIVPRKKQAAPMRYSTYAAILTSFIMVLP